MNRVCLLLSLTLAVPLLSGCGSSGKECDDCGSDRDCDAGLTCRNYGLRSGKSLGNHCAASRNTACEIDGDEGYRPID